MLKSFELVRTDVQPFVSAIAEAIKQDGDEFIAICCFHKETHPSLYINEKKGIFYCHGCGAKGYILGYVKEESSQAEAIYSYTDEESNLLFQVVRFQNKHFAQRRLEKEHWVWNLQGVRKVIYQLPSVLAKPDPIVLVEGEKDADNLIERGFNATTNPGGGGKWTEDFNPFFENHCVVILPDNDEKGQEHAKMVATYLKAVTSSIKIVALPGLKHKEDVTDWLQIKGNTESGLKKLIIKAGFEKEEVEEFADSLEKFLVAGEQEVQWLVQNLIPKSGITLLAARPKAGKSIMALNLALGLRQGNFLNYKCEAARSLIIQLEDPDPVSRMRLIKMGAMNTGVEGVWIRTGLGLSPDLLPEMVEFIKKYKIDLVIIDPLIYATGGADENDAAKMAKFFLGLRTTAFETGAGFLIVHHHRKSMGEHGEQVRGSSAIIGAVDVVLELRRMDVSEEEEESEGACVAELQAISRVSAPPNEVIVLNTDTLVWESGGASKSWKREQQKVKIQKAVSEEGEVSLVELKSTLEMRSGILIKYLKELTDEKRIEGFEKTEPGNPQPSKWYRITTEARLPW